MIRSNLVLVTTNTGESQNDAWNSSRVVFLGNLGCYVVTKPLNSRKVGPDWPIPSTKLDRAQCLLQFGRVESFHHLRKEYGRAALSRQSMDADPMRQFTDWFQVALEEAVGEPNAMILATVDARGKPSSRTVLLKGFDERGFCFFTNYGGRKGRELAGNPHAALTFWWHHLERQVNVAGEVEKLTHAESEAYFLTRPRNSQLGAAVSPQSEVIPNREWLEERLAALKIRYENAEIPMPEFWGGYRLRPSRIEFWQGQRSRLHDRFQYTLLPDGNWRLDRLSP